MAQLQINRCKVCTRPLPAGVNKCPKCGTEHQIVPEVVNPLRFSPKEAEEYKQILEQQTKANPADTNSLFGMGLVYLGLQHYELANKNFQKAVEQTPDNPDVYYYYALSLFAHRSPATLSALEAERIEMWLQTALKMQAKRKYLILEMLLLQGAFKGKGKAVPFGKPEPEELLRQALNTVQEEDELYEIEQHVVISDPRNRDFVAELRGERKTSGASGADSLRKRLAAYGQLCKYPKGDDDGSSTEEGVMRLMDPAERKDFFLGLHKPNRPHMESKESVFSPVWFAVKRGIICFIVWIVMCLIASVCWTDKREFAIRMSAEEYVEKNFPDLKRKRKAEKVEEVRCDSIENARLDSIFMAEHVVHAWEYRHSDSITVEGTGVLTAEKLAQLPADVEYMKMQGIMTGWRLWAFLFCCLAAPLYWVIAVILAFRNCFRSRRETAQRNRTTMNTYHEYERKYESRPTVEDYKRFCQLFVGPNAGLVTQGDVVSIALREAGISEQDVTKGKVYLFNCFFDCTSDGVETTNPEVVLRYMGINVAVAMPDQVLYMKAVWDTVEDTLPRFEQSSIMYSQIAMFQKTEDQIIIKSNTGVELVPITTNWGHLPSLFCYQSTESSDLLTYSRTRTTDRNEFYKSLVDMHGRYNKQ